MSTTTTEKTPADIAASLTPEQRGTMRRIAHGATRISGGACDECHELGLLMLAGVWYQASPLGRQVAEHC